MNVEIIQAGRVLRAISHNSQTYLEAPPQGEYEIRLTNTSPKRRCAVVSVDGINVVDGKDAGINGSGYVLSAWESLTIKGFLRSNSECARFTFTASDASYASQTGRGTKNTGIIGVAVFDEKEKPVAFVPPVIIREIHHFPVYPVLPVQNPFQPIWYGTFSNSDQVTLGRNYMSNSGGSAPASMDFSCSTADSVEINPISESTCAKEAQSTKSTRSRSAVSAQSLGTAYGKAETFHTSTTEFIRASSNPVLMLTLRYGTTEKLREWGVPMPTLEELWKQTETPTAFPASPGYAQPPAGWVR